MSNKSENINGNVEAFRERRPIYVFDLAVGLPSTVCGGVNIWEISILYLVSLKIHK